MPACLPAPEFRYHHIQLLRSSTLALFTLCARVLECGVCGALALFPPSSLSCILYRSLESICRSSCCCGCVVGVHTMSGMRSNQPRLCLAVVVSCCLTPRCLPVGGGGGGDDRSAHPQGCTRVAEVGGNKGIAVPKFKASVAEVQVEVVFVFSKVFFPRWNGGVD